MTVFKFALLRALRSPAALISNFAAPLAMVLITPMWTADDGFGSGFFMLAFLLLFGSFFAARGIFNDKFDGTVVRILSGPMSTLGYLVQNLLACMAVMGTQIIVIVIIGAALYGWGFTLALALILCYTMFAASSVAFSFAWSCLFKSKEVIVSVFTAVAMVMGALGGLMFPANLLPRTLYFIGAIFPSHWASRGLTTLLEYGMSAGMFWLSMLALTLFIIAFLLYGGKRRII